VARRLVRGGHEVRISKSASAALHDHHSLFAGDNVCNEVATDGVKDRRPWWNPNL
jgi:hypothetical protein